MNNAISWVIIGILMFIITIGAFVNAATITKTNNNNVTGGNNSWTQALADTLYAPIGSTGGNSSWNETRANTLYYSFNNPAGYYNFSTLPAYPTPDNTSWNQTYANTLYYLLTNPAGYYNITTLPAYPIADNSSWNQSYADVLYLRNASIPTCSGTDKLTSTGNGIVTCATDQTGSGGNINGTDVAPRYINATTTINAEGGLGQHGLVPVVDLQTYYCDFMTAYAVTMCYPNYFITVATGAPLKAAGQPGRPGILNFTSTAAANTGAIAVTDAGTFLLNGSELYAAAFSYGAGAEGPGNISLIQAGFIDTTALQTESVDGVYFYIRNKTLSSRISNNSARNLSTVNLTIVPGQWYELRIVIDATANSANFLVYNGTYDSTNTSPLYNQTITNTAQIGIPRTIGRETGSGFTCGMTTAGIAKGVCQLDYIQTEIETNRRPRLMP